MFKKILAAFDGSKQSQKALKEALGLARKAGAALTVLNVDEDMIPLVSETGPAFMVQKELDAMAQLEIRKAKFIARKAGVKAEYVLVKGHPAAAILDYAKRGKFDMVVVGAKGVGGIERLLLGSVSESVVSHAHCAVLIVK